jgi:hypothetical protein
MEEEAGINGEKDERNNKEVYTKIVRAGKRTYFFDVKATRKDDYYLTVTESKKRIGKDGKAFYEKHKIFLYKEDFEKFSEGLRDVVDFIESGQIPESPVMKETSEEMIKDEKGGFVASEFTNVDFEDLGKV